MNVLSCPACGAINEAMRTHCFACQRTLSPENRLPGSRGRSERLPFSTTTPANPSAFPHPSRRRIRRRGLVGAIVGLGALTVAGGTVGWLFFPWVSAPHPSVVYRGHSKEVTLLAWSPDGKHLASSAYDNTVQIWNASDGSPVFTYRKLYDPPYALIWSPDSKRIAIAWAGAYIWDAEDGGHEVAYRDRGADNKIFVSIAWSPNGQYLAGGSEDGVYIWNPISGRDITIYPHLPDGINGNDTSVAWSPDSQRIASSRNDGTVQVWDALTGEDDLTYRGHVTPDDAYRASEGYDTTVAWSPDGTRIASAGIDGNIQIWDASNGGHILTYSGHTPVGIQLWGGVYAFPSHVAWSPDGKRLASSDDAHALKIWDAATGQTLSTYANASGPLAWSPDGTHLAFAADDHTVLVCATR